MTAKQKVVKTVDFVNFAPAVPGKKYTCPGCGVETGPARQDYEQSGHFCSYRCWLKSRGEWPA